MQLNVKWHHRPPLANSIHHGKLYQIVSILASTPLKAAALTFHSRLRLGWACRLTAITWYPNYNSCTDFILCKTLCVWLRVLVFLPQDITSALLQPVPLKRRKDGSLLVFHEICCNDIFICIQMRMQTLCVIWMSCKIILILKCMPVNY